MPSDSAFAVKPTLVGERVTLRPYREEDLPHLTAAVNDPEAGRLTGSVHTTAESEADTYPEQALRQRYST
ncbi:hypothetical protein BH24ACT8_BH24ACT8_11400 [soil metagenome]